MPAGDINAIKGYIDEKVDINTIVDAVIAQISSSGTFVTGNEFGEYRNAQGYKNSQDSKNFKSLLNNQDGTSGLKSYFINLHIETTADVKPYALVKFEEDVQTDPQSYTCEFPVTYYSYGNWYEGSIDFVGNFHTGSNVNVYIAPPVFGPVAPNYTLLGSITLSSYDSNFAYYNWDNS